MIYYPIFILMLAIIHMILIFFIPSQQFEEGIEKTIRWYLDYQKYYEDMYKGK